MKTTEGTIAGSEFSASLTVLAKRHGKDGTRESEYINKLLDQLSEAYVPRATVRQCIHAITQFLLPIAFPRAIDGEITLVPVLRAGMAMLPATLEFFPNAVTSFVSCSKLKGTDHVSVNWLKSTIPSVSEIVLLDTVVATGDTVAQVCVELLDRCRSAKGVTVVTCYAAPQGIRTLFDRCRTVRAAVACMAETVSADGYLIPRINGDMGDKLFGT
jgi:uracil phosphoribosyltransferase